MIFSIASPPGLAMPVAEHSHALTVLSVRALGLGATAATKPLTPSANLGGADSGYVHAELVRPVGQADWGRGAQRPGRGGYPSREQSTMLNRP